MKKFFQKWYRFLASNFTKNELPDNYLLWISTASFRRFFYKTTWWLLLNKINQFCWIGLLTVIMAIGF